MNRSEYTELVRFRLWGNITGSCIGCMLELDFPQEHTCDWNCENIIGAFDYSFNQTGDDDRFESIRTSLLRELLAECEPDENVVRLHLSRYIHNRLSYGENKENMKPIYHMNI